MVQLRYGKIDPADVCICETEPAAEFLNNCFVCLFLFAVIITQTVGQMTDEKTVTTIATQTPLPQTCLSFSSLTGNAISLQQQQQKSNTKYSPFEQKILENELLLQTQRNALKNIDRILSDKRFVDRKSVGKSIIGMPSEGIESSKQPTQLIHQYINIDQTAIQMVIF